jgi:diguanylate cyclase (GGDEF)-like protein
MAQLPRGGIDPLAVLVVDERPVTRLNLCQAVEALGHTAFQAGDAEGAWAGLQVRPMDLVLVHWPDPDGDVMELVRRIRAREAAGGSSLTSVFLLAPPSARPSVPDALAAGADGFVATPVDDVALQVALHQAGQLARLAARSADQAIQLARQGELLREEVRTDAVTRLGNRIRLDEDLRRLRGRVQRYGHRATAVAISVDYLRRYNEALGRAAGDDVLRKVARAIRGCLRDADSAYRYAGEEILVLLPEQGEDGGFVVAERCRAAVSELHIPHPRSDAGAQVTVSVGVAELGDTGRDGIDEWLRSAELALDAAKAAGRNGVARAGHTRIAGKDATT